jgi:hypothetical protein
MIKKIRSDKDIAFNYYINANLISLVPGIITIFLINKVVTTFLQYLLFSLITYCIIMFFSLKWSGKNISKNFIIIDTKPIANWTVRYLLFFNLIFLIYMFSSVGYFSLAMLMFVFDILISGIIIYKFTHEFINISSTEEIEQAKKESELNPQNIKSVFWQILNTALLTIAGFILLLLIPCIFYFFITYSVGLPSKIALFLVLIWEVIIIFLSKKFYFDRVKGR